jgi:hypothetical protein
MHAAGDIEHVGLTDNLSIYINESGKLEQLPVHYRA